ncbi:GntR family transcriptional regulator [Labrys miyagiensis]
MIISNPAALTPLERLARPRSLAELVIHEIRELIVSGRLGPGEQLSESVLAEQLGVSRTPVREAFLRLETEHLVEVRPQRGTFVFQYNEAQLRDICELREVLETGALRIAISRNREALVSQLDKVASLSETESTPNLADYQSLDNAFHEALVKASENRELIEAYARISGRVRTIRYRLTRTPQQLADSRASHREIVEAIRAGRDAEAVTSLGLHVYNPYELFRRMGELKGGSVEGQA